MRNLLNPRWLLLINTLPIILLFWLLGDTYNIIHTLLSESHLEEWKWQVSVLSLLGFLNLMYAFYLMYAKQTVHLVYGIIALITYSAFLYFYNENSYQMIPSSVPRWMLPEDLWRYVGAFIMPTLAHAFFVIVFQLTPLDKEQSAGKNLGGAFLLPFLFFVFFRMAQPLWRVFDYRFENFLMIGGIGVIMTSLFLLIRGMYILVNKKSKFWRENSLLWRFPIAIIFPLAGLSLSLSMDNPFGNFSSIWFFILAFVTGVAICVEDSENSFARLLRFGILSFTFSYTLYFFFVFLPLLPFGIAFMVIGFGFLILTPLMLFFIHCRELKIDFAFLHNYYSYPVLMGIFFACFSALPISVGYSYLNDKTTLKKALDYVYEPNFFEEAPNIKPASLKRVLNTVKSQKKRRWGSRNQIPLLYRFYTWLVLDNQTLSDSKIETLFDVFFEEEARENVATIASNPAINTKENISIDSLSTHSVFDEEQQAWRTWIDLEIQNHQRRQNEYRTVFELPDGAWISDYYLWVGDEKKMGLLAEKKAAMWIYKQITSQRRDPGLLHYLEGNKIAFRVFPFGSEQVRKTGFEILHKEPFDFTIDEQTIRLGNDAQQPLLSEVIYTDDRTTAYIPQAVKTKLDKITRTPYFHFIVDGSLGTNLSLVEYQDRLEGFLEKDTLGYTDFKITFCNAFTKEYGTSIVEQFELFKKEEQKSGFFLERAINEILLESYANPTDSYPVVVVITDNMKRAILPTNFNEIAFAFPEQKHFYALSYELELIPYSLTENPKKYIAPTYLPKPKKVVKWEDTESNTIAYLPDNADGNIVLLNKKQTFNFDKNVKEKQWNNALHLQGQWQYHNLYPQNVNREWVQLVRNSFVHHVLTPVTSFMVVENAAQEAMLKKKQEQLLNSDKSMDAGEEEVRRMSEPNLWICLLILLLFRLFVRRKKSVLISKRRVASDR